MGKKRNTPSVGRIHDYVQRLCGIYSRVARKLGVNRSFVSRVARGERQSSEVEQALTTEFNRVQDETAT